MLLQETPLALVDAFAEKRCVLFVGAGISIASGLPRGSDLAFQLQNELFRNKFVDLRPSPDQSLQLEVVAQRYQLAFGRQRLNELLLRTFQRDGVVPNEGHKLAVKLFQHMITTNFDRLLEEALRQESRNPIVVVRDLQLPSTSIPDRTVIYKIHGDIGTPDRIVITQRDYARVPLTEGILTELRSMFMTKTVIFVGYGLADSDLVRQLEFRRSVLGTEVPKAYAVLPGADKDPLFVKQCDEDNIDAISDIAVDFLKDLDQAAQVYVAKSPPSPRLRPEALLSQADREYRATVCEEFKWIDFKGIPVLGGYLRVPIDKLFVSLSAMPETELEPESRERRRSHAIARQATLFRKASEGKGLFDVLKENPKVVLLGDPGSGKTTFLRYVGYHLSLPNPEPEKIGLEKAYLPIFVSLREYATLAKNGARRPITTVLPDLLKAHDLEKYVPVIRGALDRGEAILLLDGLDEVASEDERAAVAQEVKRLSTSCGDCRIVLTSRRVGYPKAPVRDGLRHVVVDPLSDQDIQTFIDLWCKATETEKERQNLLEAIKEPRVRALAENPLLITILARVYKAYRNLPERRAALYAKCVEALLTTWDLMRDLPPVFQDVREANRIMGPLALWIHRDCGGGFVTAEQILDKLAQIGELPREAKPTVLLTQIEERSGLLRQVGLNQYAFTHLTFQEYYVAREIVSQGNCFRRVRRFLKDDRWQEVIRLTAGLLDDQGKTPVTEFMDSFLVEPSFPLKASNAQLRRLNLLIACLKDKVEPEPYIGDYVHKAILGIAEKAEFRRPIMQGLSHLQGFAKTRIGGRIIADFETAIGRGDEGQAVENFVVLGHYMFLEALDRLSFLVGVLSTASTKIGILGSVAMAVNQILRQMPDSSVRAEFEKKIVSIPFERRLQILELTPSYSRDESMIEMAVATWTRPDEVSMLPPRLQPARKSGVSSGAPSGGVEQR